MKVNLVDQEVAAFSLAEDRESIIKHFYQNLPYLEHFPGGSGDWLPLVTEKVSEENIGEQSGRLRRRRGLAEGISPTEKSVTVSCLTQGVASSQESGELPETETHHGDVILQHLHRLIRFPAGKLRRSQLKVSE